jgi:hypothetical protein
MEVSTNQSTINHCLDDVPLERCKRWGAKGGAIHSSIHPPQVWSLLIKLVLLERAGM